MCVWPRVWYYSLLAGSARSPREEGEGGTPGVPAHNVFGSRRHSALRWSRDCVAGEWELVCAVGVRVELFFGFGFSPVGMLSYEWGARSKSLNDPSAWREQQWLGGRCKNGYLLLMGHTSRCCDGRAWVHRNAFSPHEPPFFKDQLC